MFLSFANSKSLLETSLFREGSVKCHELLVRMQTLVSLAINCRSQPQNTRPIIATLEKTRLKNPFQITFSFVFFRTPEKEMDRDNKLHAGVRSKRPISNLSTRFNLYLLRG